MRAQGRTVAKLFGIYLIATCAGYAAARVGLPLPWTIGPLLVIGFLTLTGLVTAVIPVSTRPFGQGVVAAQVGLYFTPAAFASLIEQSSLIIGMALLTISVACCFAFLMSRVAAIPLTYAVIATIPTSPVEAAVVAERFGFPTPPIILAHTLRIAAVVVILPLGIYAINGAPVGSTLRAIVGFEPVGNLLVGLIAIAGILVFRKLRISNPFFLGPLAFVAILTAMNVPLAPVPSILQWAAQIVLGTWYGSTLRRHLFIGAGRLMTAMIVTSLGFVLTTAGVALVLAGFLAIDWETFVLATAPGGVTEMSLTASFLGANVALVAAFHIARVFIIIPNLPWFIRLVSRLDKRPPT